MSDLPDARATSRLEVPLVSVVTSPGATAMIAVAASAGAKLSWTEIVSERLNPILVKETRQALKSKQFSFTFLAVLALAWGWTMLGLAMAGPTVSYSNAGPGMLMGYEVILAFAVILIVPFSAYRSMASEREDGTFELLAITTMRARQIVGGKLGSAVVQMLVYVSALAPCIAFTYLLRGIDLLTISILLLFTILASFGLSIIALLMATLTTQRFVHIFLSVAVVLGLFFSFMGTIGFASALLDGELFREYPEGLGSALIEIATFYLGFMALFFAAATANLTFSSENRSTMLRVIMLGQQAILSGWLGYHIIHEARQDVLIPIVGTHGILSMLYWWLMGAFMTCESSRLSDRARRRLPHSTFGRMYLTWLNPGPEAGLAMAVFSHFATVTLGILTMFIGNAWLNRLYGGGGWNESAMVCALLSQFFYLVIYLGIGRFILRSLAARFRPHVAIGIVVQILLLLAGSLPPMFWRLSVTGGYDYGYRYYELSSPIATMAELVNDVYDRPSFVSTYSTTSTDAPIITVILGVFAGVIWLANLKYVLRESRVARVAAPTRVAEEELAEAERLHPKTWERANPWDEEPISESPGSG